MTLQTHITTLVIISNILFIIAFFTWISRRDALLLKQRSVIGATLLLLPATILQAFSLRYQSLVVVSWGVTFLAFFFLFIMSHKTLRDIKKKKIVELVHITQAYETDPELQLFTREILRPQLKQHAQLKKENEKLTTTNKELELRIKKKKEDLETIAKKITERFAQLAKKEEQHTKQEKLLKKLKEDLEDEQEEIKEELDDIKILKERYETRLEHVEKQEDDYQRVIKTRRALDSQEAALKKEEERFRERQKQFKEFLLAKELALKDKEKKLKELKSKLEEKEEDLEDKEDDLAEQEKKLQKKLDDVMKNTNGAKK